MRTSRTAASMAAVRVFLESSLKLPAHVLVFGTKRAQRTRQPEETMKRILVVASLALLSLGFVQLKPQPYRVVFDLTSRDSLEQKAVLRWLKEVGTASPDAQMEVVMYGKGFELVMPERSAFAADVKEAMKNPNVSFRVCAIALKNNNVEK